VARASVDVAGERVSQIGPGLLALVGVTHDDGPDEAAKLAASSPTCACSTTTTA
jgi:D-tyrosyl-tRNA(Tyr) deacylase